MLFACYPLAPIAAVIGGLGVEFRGLYLGLSVLISAAYYALLISSLRDCGKVGGWAGRFYQLALLSVVLHMIPACFLFGGPAHWQDLAFAGVLLTMFAVYACCSLAGAAMAKRNGKWIQVGSQLFWPVSLLAIPILGPHLTVASAPLLILPVIGFGIQGLQALFLALSLDVPFGESWGAEPDLAIGWEVPAR